MRTICSPVRNRAQHICHEYGFDTVVLHLQGIVVGLTVRLTSQTLHSIAHVTWSAV